MIGWDQTFLPSETDDKLRKNTYYVLRGYCDEVVSVGEDEDEVAIQGVEDDEHVVIDEVTETVPVQKARGGGDRENGWGGRVGWSSFSSLLMAASSRSSPTSMGMLGCSSPEIALQ